jgi:hypothetical protein
VQRQTSKKFYLPQYQNDYQTKIKKMIMFAYISLIYKPESKGWTWVERTYK